VTSAGQDGFKDHFSGHAADYARYRPPYPGDLFAWLADKAPGNSLAWDVGTGNGQIARGLAGRFRQVHASDASTEQIAQAGSVPGVRFVVERAEDSSLEDASADLVTVGQALHWFDLEVFYAEVLRVARPGALVAALTYQFAEVTPAVDREVLRLARDILKAWWPSERVLVDREYQGLAFPFREFDPPRFSMTVEMDLARYCRYLRTWSATRRYMAGTGQDPLHIVSAELEAGWGDPERNRKVRWPLIIRAGFR
jgi:ubiquinone/menaquinone biosynthesis C-methylase UbiE